MEPGDLTQPQPPSPGKLQRARRAAWLLALAADAVQWVALPLFAPGAASPFDTALDVAVGVAMVRLLGWHWAFLPTFAAELIPGVSLVPTWTLAVWLATRGRPHRDAGR